jgi:hypothetical protein
MPSGIAVHNRLLVMADRQSDKMFRRRLTEDLREWNAGHCTKNGMGDGSDGKTLWWWMPCRENHQVDPKTARPSARFRSGSGPTGIAWDGVSCGCRSRFQHAVSDGSETGWVISSMPSPGPYPSALLYFDNTLWVADYQTRKLYRVRLPEKLRVLEDDERRVRVSYQVVYRASGTGKIRKLTAYLAVPKEMPGQHILVPLQFTPAPTRTVQDRWGQEIAVFELGDFRQAKRKA